MKCPNCGKSFRSNFCPKCGAKAPKKSNSNKKTKIIIIVMSIVIAVLLVLLCVISFYKGVPSENAEAVPTPVPTPISEPTDPEPENYLLSLEITEKNITAWDGTEYTEKVMYGDKDDAKAMSEEDFLTFFNDVIFGNGGVDIFLLFDDNTGICFDNGTECIYGKLTSTLSFSEIQKVITVKGNSLSIRDCNANGKPYVFPSKDSLANEYPTGGYDLNSSVDCIEAIAKQAFGDQLGECVYSETEFRSPCLFININCDGYRYSQE